MPTSRPSSSGAGPNLVGLPHSRRTLVGRGFWTVLDQGLFAAGNFAVNVLLARWLAPADYGAFTVAFVVFLLAGAVHGGLFVEPMLVFGAGRFRGRVAAYVRVLLVGHGAFALAAGGLLGLGALACALAGAKVLAASLGVLAVAQAAILFLWLMRRACHAVERPMWAAGGGAAYLVFVVGGAAGLAAAGQLSGPLGFVLMGGGALVVGLGLAVKLGVPLRLPSRSLRRRVWALHRRYGRWASLTGGLEWMQLALPFLVLPLVIGLEGSAAFRALYNLATPVLQGLQALTVVALPLFVQADAAGQIGRALRRCALLLVGGAALYGLMLGIFGPALTTWLYRGQYDVSAAQCWLMALVLAAAAASAVLMAALRAQERPRAVFGARMGAVGAAATGGVGLVAVFGVAGAVASDLLAIGTETLLMARALKKSPNGRASAPMGDGQAGVLPTLASADNVLSDGSAR